MMIGRLGLHFVTLLNAFVLWEDFILVYNSSHCFPTCFFIMIFGEVYIDRCGGDYRLY